MTCSGNIKAPYHAQSHLLGIASLSCCGVARRMPVAHLLERFFSFLFCQERCVGSGLMRVSAGFYSGGGGGEGGETGIPP